MIALLLNTPLPCMSPPSSLQVLLEDFSCSGGYKLLYEYLLHLERTGTEDAREAERNMVLLISNNLVPAGFLSLEPTLSDGGPLQDPDFVIPVPQDGGQYLCMCYIRHCMECAAARGEGTRDRCST